MCVYVCVLPEIGHSDPEKLKVAAQDAKRLTPEQLAKRRADIKVSTLSLLSAIKGLSVF